MMLQHLFLTPLNVSDSGRCPAAVIQVTFHLILPYYQSIGTLSWS